MQTFIADTEVFAYDYLVVFKNKETKEYLRFHNDPDGVKSVLEMEDAIFAFFNGKHYDRFILSAIVRDGRPEVVKAVNDFIISGHEGWEYPDRDLVGYQFPMYDLMDDCQMGLSLKAIEAHLGMDIRETTVPFDIDRPLTEAEKEEVEFYCDHDVDATDTLDDLRQGYLQSKIAVGGMVGIPPEKALYMTNAKLTAEFLGAEAKEHDDERKYKYPDNLRKEFIPDEVFHFFNRLYDSTIPDEEIFKSKLQLNIGECPVVIGFGGVHAAIPNYQFREDGENVGNSE